MPEMTPALALRDLKQVHAGLKKARQLVTQARESPALAPAALDTGWESLVRAHRLMASIPRSAVDEAVLGQQISVQRYATALLVRLRRLLRREEADAGDDLADDLDDE
ncbi:MAG: hypothetical protein U0790_20490 [Isosphaeraceae bacterium]